MASAAWMDELGSPRTGLGPWGGNPECDLPPECEEAETTADEAYPPEGEETESPEGDEVDLAGSEEAPEHRACIPFPDSELLEQLKESERRISANWGGLNKMTMAIGWDGYFIKRHDGWRLLGYEDEKHFRKVKGIKRSTWYKMVGIAERLQHLNLEEFLSMSIENAEQLSVQPLEAKRDRELLLKAQSATAEEFRDELVMATARRESKPLGEVYVTMKWRIRQAQREVIERGLEDWQQEHGIDDPGYALELMIAEYRERLTLVGFMTESIPRLTRQVLSVHNGEEMELGELRELREAFAIHLREMGEVLRICCGEAADAASSEQ
jgi:hypothetical protein